MNVRGSVRAGAVVHASAAIRAGVVVRAGAVRRRRLEPGRARKREHGVSEPNVSGAIGQRQAQIEHRQAQMEQRQARIDQQQARPGSQGLPSHHGRCR